MTASLRNISKLMLLLLAGLFAVGCSSVRFDNPIGDKADLETLDKIHIEGTYIAGDTNVAIKDVGNGRFSVGIMQWRDDKWQVLEIEGEIRKAGDIVLVNLKSPKEDEGDKAYYTAARIAASPNGDLVLFGTDAHAFELAIANDELDGSVKQENKVVTVTVTSTSDELTAFVTPERAGTLFHVDSPTVLRRISEKKDK